MTKEKKSLLTISVLMQIIYIFFDVFFSIFVYDISKNLNIIILYSIINVPIYWLTILCLYKFINKKLLSIMYKLSFIMSIIAIALTFTISKDTIFMIFLTQIFLKFTHICYYMPHEVATMNSNKKHQMKKFVGLSFTLSLIAGAISPFISGLIIDHSSYYIIFLVLIILSIICFILSFNVDNIKYHNQHYGIKQFLKDSHSNKGIRYGYSAHLFFNLCNDGVVALFLPLLIFLKTGNNFSVGIYASLASIFSGVFLIIYCYFTKNKKIAMCLCTAFQLVASAAIIIFNSIIIFFVYYFVKKITTEILKNGLQECVFTIVQNTPLEPYSLENFYTYNFYRHGGVLIACIISIIVYNISNNIITITILLALFSITQIISTILLNKSDKLLNTKNEIQDITTKEKRIIL